MAASERLISSVARKRRDPAASVNVRCRDAYSMSGCGAILPVAVIEATLGSGAG
jgi:hypothetical protein